MKKKINYWKIGTKIENYLDNFFKLENVNKDNLNKKVTFVGLGDKLFVEIDGKTNEYNQNSKNSGTWVQAIKSLLAMKVIEPFDETKKIFDDFINVKYKLLAFDFIGCEENLIEYLSDKPCINEWICSKDDDTEYDEDSYIIQWYSNSGYSEIEAIFSFFKDLTMNKDTIERYWYISKFKKISEFKKLKNRILLCQKSEFVEIDYKKLFKNTYEGENIKYSNELQQKVEKYISTKLHTLRTLITYLMDKNMKIKIPLMQRNYVWTKELIKNLFTDIKNVAFPKEEDDNEKNNFHYISQIVYSEKNGRLKILDGQQRLTSLFIIMTAIVLSYNDIYKENRKIVDSDLKIKEEDIKFDNLLKLLYDGDDDIFIKKLFEKISGNSDYNVFYKIIDITIYNDASNDYNDSQMVSNLGKIIELIKEEMEGKSFKWKFNYLDKILNSLFDKIFFSFNKNNKENEYEIFENLNTLSVELSKIDLIKNYLLTFIDDEVLENQEAEIQSSFSKNIYDKFIFNGKNSDTKLKEINTNINLFITFLINSNLNLIKGIGNKTDFDKFKLTIKRKYEFEKSKKLDFHEFDTKLKEIGKEIEIFFEITRIDKYTSEDSKFRLYWDILFMFNKRYVYVPIIYFIIKKFGPNKFKSNKFSDLDDIREKNKINNVREMLFILEKFEVLFQITQYRGQSLTLLGTKLLEELISICDGKDIENTNDFNEIKIKFSEVFNNLEIMNKYASPNIDDFVKKIKNSSTPNKMQLILVNRIEYYIYQSNNLKRKFSISFDEIEKPDGKWNRGYIPIWESGNKPSVEHILPQEPKSWEEVYKKSKYLDKIKTTDDFDFTHWHKELVDKLGNIIILSKKANSSISNKVIEEKVKEYEKNYSLTKRSNLYKGINKDNNYEIELTKVKNYQINDLNEKYFYGENEIEKRTNAYAKLLENIYKN